MRSQAEFIENLGPRGHGNSLGGGCGVGEGDLFGIAKEQQTGASHRGAVRRKRLRMMDDIIRESWESKLMGSRSVWTSLNCSMRKPPPFFFFPLFPFGRCRPSGSHDIFRASIAVSRLGRGMIFSKPS